MTAHAHKVDDATQITNSEELVDVPPGWMVVSCDDLMLPHVCSHYWQSDRLLLADGYADCMKQGQDTQRASYVGKCAHPQRHPT